MKGLLGKKIGMTQIFDEDGKRIPVTVLEAGPCTILSVRTAERNGYEAIQLGFGKRRLKNIPRAMRAYLARAGLEEWAPWSIREIRLDEAAGGSVGDTLYCDIFEVGDFVDVTGVTKGRGFQGVVRRHGFGGGRATHGGDWLRRPGSIGMCEFPAKVYKGRKMPGQMGHVQRTVQNLRIVQVRKDDNAILVRGAVPGPAGSYVMIRQAKKKTSEVAK